MIMIKNDNDIEMKNIIHTNLRKNNIEKCEWLRNNVSTNIKISNAKNSNFLAFDDNKLIGGAIGFVEYNWYYAIYTAIEIILLCVISGTFLRKIKNSKKLLLSETIIACIDIICLFIAAITLSWQGLFIAYILTGITSTMGDPIWGSIISAYSTNSRKKYVLVNRVYFIIRATFTVIIWFICRECVIHGIESFRYLAVFLICMIIIFYVIANKFNKKVFGDSI